MPALRQRLLLVGATAMTILRQLGGARGNLVQGAAGACNRASQSVDQHPWRTQSHTPAIAFLPAFIRNLLNMDLIAQADDLMDESSMQALAIHGELALLGGEATAGGQIAFTVLPHQGVLAALLGACL